MTAPVPFPTPLERSSLGAFSEIMTPDEQEQMNALCAQIITEKDPAKFMRLVSELNALLERKEIRLKPDADPTTHD